MVKKKREPEKDPVEKQEELNQELKEEATIDSSEENNVLVEENISLKAESEKLSAENDELKAKILRQMAEFDNYKKRTTREKNDLYNYAKSDCVETLLGVIDNFERALDTECSDATFKKGVEMIFTQFTETLKKLGVEEIIALNETFDPEFHNAVNQVEDENFGENTVSQVFQKGYKIGDKVIRHAMVVVANP